MRSQAMNADRFERLVEIAHHETRIANYYAEASELGIDDHGPVNPDSAWRLEGAHRVRAAKAARLADRALARTVTQ